MSDNNRIECTSSDNNKIIIIRGDKLTQQDETVAGNKFLESESSLSFPPIVQQNVSDYGGDNTSSISSQEPIFQNNNIVHEKEFTSPLARVQIDCSRDKTLIKVNFTKAFKGILTAGKPDTTNCRLEGNGRQNYYELSVLHNESRCDTQWDVEDNSITNTLYIRFHRSLETGADISKNLMCRLTVGDLLVGKKPVKTPSSSSPKLKHLKNNNNNKSNINLNSKQQQQEPKLIPRPPIQ